MPPAFALYLHHHETLRGIFSERWAYLRWQNGSDSKNMFQFVWLLFPVVSCCWSRYFCFVPTTIWEHLTFVYTAFDVLFSLCLSQYFFPSFDRCFCYWTTNVFFSSSLQTCDNEFDFFSSSLFFILVSSSTRLSICFVCFFLGGEREIQMPQFKRKKSH